jgi:DNA-binding PadR family transcriptional regulator
VFSWYQGAHDRLPGVRPASLYDAVQRLEDAGLVGAGESGREGRRPERVRYAITRAGRQALADWVADPQPHLAATGPRG